MPPATGRSNRALQPFVHLDVQSAYSVGGTSPSLPDDYVRALGRQYPLNADTSDQPRPVLALADYGLHSAVKAAVACARSGVEHIAGLRARVVAERSFRVWGEQPRELILLAIDDVGWTNIVQLSNLGQLCGGDWRGPRIDWRDLAVHAELAFDVIPVRIAAATRPRRSKAQTGDLPRYTAISADGTHIAYERRGTAHRLWSYTGRPTTTAPFGHAACRSVLTRSANPCTCSDAGRNSRRTRGSQNRKVN